MKPEFSVVNSEIKFNIIFWTRRRGQELENDEYDDASENHCLWMIRITAGSLSSYIRYLIACIHCLSSLHFQGNERQNDYILK